MKLGQELQEMFRTELTEGKSEWMARYIELRTEHIESGVMIALSLWGNLQQGRVIIRFWKNDNVRIEQGLQENRRKRTLWQGKGAIANSRINFSDTVSRELLVHNIADLTKLFVHSPMDEMVRTKISEFKSGMEWTEIVLSADKMILGLEPHLLLEESVTNEPIRVAFCFELSASVGNFITSVDQVWLNSETRSFESQKQRIWKLKRGAQSQQLLSVKSTLGETALRMKLRTRILCILLKEQI